MIETILKTQEYLEYIQEHYNNVQKAWEIIKDKCKNNRFNFIYDDFLFSMLDNEIKNHDKSKLSDREFVQYRKWFYSTKQESLKQKRPLLKCMFDSAWQNHLKNNNHHWENWTTMKESYPNEKKICVVHNVIDWMAMGMKFGDTAQEYYKKNKTKIIIPKWAEIMIYRIFECINE